MAGLPAGLTDGERLASKAARVDVHVYYVPGHGEVSRRTLTEQGIILQD